MLKNKAQFEDASPSGAERGSAAARADPPIATGLARGADEFPGCPGVMHVSGSYRGFIWLFEFIT